MFIIGVNLSLRIFSVNRDGSYNEVPPVKESLLHRGEAFIIVDRREKNIYIYRKTGISSSLAYSAGRAATNLNTRKGSKYKLINIENEDKDRILSVVLDKLEEVSEEENFIEFDQIASEVKPRTNYVFGEKIRRNINGEEENFVEKPITKTYEIKKSEMSERTTAFIKEETTGVYDLEGVVKALAGKLLFEIEIENTKTMKKPPKHELRAELIKRIDNLLDSIY